MVKKKQPDHNKHPPPSKVRRRASQIYARPQKNTGFFRNIGTNDLQHIQQRSQTRQTGDSARALTQNALDSSPNQVNLIRELTHDWLMYHSTHCEHTQASCIAALILKINTDGRLHKLQSMLNTYTKHDAHCLPEFINNCHLNQELETLSILLALYLDARSEIASQKKDTANSSEGDWWYKQHNLDGTPA